ncbi:sporulation histidine kinase inhibitor Sda [Jeotgalibacillus proteolyticus]|uniref:Sporulation histidine kinase inhibitor Sda n=1 Tax=Jeotgalibacillus proteolyticus TaxID=2082395 RepID=A0A2S5G9X4_9BACL|nr:sporulation histidine kinase inhibitor Sda [Jeotgalibacillus proteolyticus]PPA69721.1 sporulation histidine kinase inhibitor Sda [Jeotgalibacillus proteolyticus]
MKSLKGLTDEKLIESFEIAKQKELANDFIFILEKELKNRGLVKLVS